MVVVVVGVVSFSVVCSVVWCSCSCDCGEVVVVVVVVVVV